jgi:hypothetical protein
MAATGVARAPQRTRTYEDEYRNRLQMQALTQYVLGQPVTACQPGTMTTWVPRKKESK